eukprot:670831-Pyramimonas_sp.AAC.1
MNNAGIATSESVEYCGQPLLSKDPRPLFVIRDPLVRERLYQEFSAPPGSQRAAVRSSLRKPLPLAVGSRRDEDL